MEPMNEEPPAEDSLTEGYRLPSRITDWVMIVATVTLFAAGWRWPHLAGWLILLWIGLSVAKVLEPVVFAVYWRRRR